jgi:hypothetical protein
VANQPIQPTTYCPSLKVVAMKWKIYGLLVEGATAEQGHKIKPSPTPNAYNSVTVL